MSWYFTNLLTASTKCPVWLWVSCWLTHYVLMSLKLIHNQHQEPHVFLRLNRWLTHCALMFLKPIHNQCRAFSVYLFLKNWLPTETWWQFTLIEPIGYNFISHPMCQMSVLNQWTLWCPVTFTLMQELLTPWHHVFHIPMVLHSLLTYWFLRKPLWVRSL